MSVGWDWATYPSRAAELRAAHTPEAVRALEEGNQSLCAPLPRAILGAWAEALSDKARLVSVGSRAPHTPPPLTQPTYATPFLERCIASELSGAHAWLLLVRRHDCSHANTQHYLAERHLTQADTLLATTRLADLRGLRYVDVLSYLYYAGLVHTLRQRYTEALHAWCSVRALAVC